MIGKLVLVAVLGAMALMGLGWWFGWLDRAPVVENPNRLMADVRSRLLYARGEGAILLRVDGNPFSDLDRTVLADAVLGAVQGTPQGMAMTYTLDEAAAGAPAFALRIVFNPDRAAEGTGLCRGDVAPGPAEAPGVRLMIGFCEGGRTLIWTRARLGKAAGPDDPRFAELLRTSVRTVIKRR